MHKIRSMLSAIRRIRRGHYKKNATRGRKSQTTGGRLNNINVQKQRKFRVCYRAQDLPRT